MKLKASVQKLNSKVIFAVFGAVALLFTALRFYQMNFLTDPETGFFTDMSSITVVLFYALWVVAVVLPLALCYLSSDCKTEAYVPRKSIFLSLGSLAMSFGVAIKVLSDLSLFIANVSGLSIGKYLKLSKSYIELAGIILGFAAVFVLLANAIGFLTGAKYVTSLKFCQLLPSLWMFTVTVAHFKINVSYFNVTQLMLQIFADAFLMLFFFEFARFISDIGIGDSDWLVWASGFSALVLLCAASVPSLVFFLTSHTEKCVSYCPFNWYGVAAIIFVCAGLFTVLKNGEKKVIHIEPLSASREEASDGE